MEKSDIERICTTLFLLTAAIGGYLCGVLIDSYWCILTAAGFGFLNGSVWAIVKTYLLDKYGY